MRPLNVLMRIAPRAGLSFLLASLLASSGFLAGAEAASVPPTLPIYQTPLTVAIPAHPQILFAVGNSQSTDGTLRGAILTGSGQLNASMSTALAQSSSPPCETVPAGFIPPLSAAGTGGCSSTAAPVTVPVGALLEDNSDSRLNLAKAAIESVLTSYLPVADFGLIDYSTSGNGLYTTWVYYMSDTGGFTFTNSTTSVPAGDELVINPCYGYLTAASLLTSTQVVADCAKLATTLYPLASISTQQYMVVAASSDDANINDVLYAIGADPICVDYGTVSPTNPYTAYSLAQYNAGAVSVGYSKTVNTCVTSTSPTNAGFVPFSPQVMYAERGYGFYSNESASTGTVLQAMTTAVISPGSGSSPPTAASTAAAYNVFVPNLNPETNSLSSAEMKAAAVQSPLAGLMAGSLNYYTTKNPASSNGCPPTRYVVLITDGLPTLDLSGNSWPPLGNASATGYGVTASYNADGTVNTTNDQALTDTITELTALNKAGIKTYVVGLGQAADPALYPQAAQALNAMAIAGGTAGASSYGYFPATSATALTNDLQAILTQIIGTTQSVSASAVNSTGLNVNSVLYQSSFSTQDTYQDWTGDLDAYALDTNGNPVVPATWDAQAQLDLQLPTSRLIATWQPATSSAIPFEWLGTSTATSATTGITPLSALGIALTNNTIQPVAADSTDSTQGLDRLNYLRGSSAKEQRNSGFYRNRTHKLGDIIDSAPIYVGPPNGAYSGTLVTSGTTYATFEAAQSTRTSVLFAGANDGMLHAFNGTTGSEIFGFIPNAVFANLPMLTSPYYNAQHHFFVDGSPSAGDAQFADGTWHTLVLGGENAGGNSIYALDVTNAAGIASETTLASDVLWEYTDTNMGYTYSAPALTLTSNTTTPFMAFFGNGYDSPTGTPFLYAVNPQTGALIRKIDLCAQVTTACSATYANGLSSVTAVNTSGVIGAPANLLYAGDLEGNIWRVDISSTTPSSWTVTVLFQARDSSSNPQPITVPPIVTLNPAFPTSPGTIVLFGTGELLSVADLSTAQTQSLYGILDPLLGATYQRSNLVAQTLALATGTGSTIATGETFITLTSNAVNLGTGTGKYQGWDVDLSPLNGSGTSGTREITPPRLEAGGAEIVTTYQPNSSECTGGGNSDFLVLNYASGGAFPTPAFAIPGSTNFNSSLLTTGTGSSATTSAAAGIQFTGDFLSGVTIQRGPQGNYKHMSSTGLAASAVSTQTILDPPIGQARRAWWELQ